MTCKAKITYGEFLQIEGLIALAHRNVEQLLELEKTALFLTGDQQGGHTSDFIWSKEGQAADLCEKLGLQVGKEAA